MYPGTGQQRPSSARVFHCLTRSNTYGGSLKLSPFSCLVILRRSGCTFRIIFAKCVLQLPTERVHSLDRPGCI